MRRVRPVLTDLQQARRLWTDRIARVTFACGAGLVLLAGVLLFSFLASEVLSVFSPARVELGPPSATTGASLRIGLTRTDDGGLLMVGRDARLYRVSSEGTTIQGAPLFPPNALERGRMLFDDARSLVALAHPEGTLMLRPLEHGDRPGSLYRGTLPRELDPGGPLALSFDSQGRGIMLAGCSRDGDLVFVRRTLGEGGKLDAPSGERILVSIPGDYEVSVLELDPLTGRVFGGTRAGALFTWRLGYAAPRWSVPGSESAGVSALALSPGGRALLVGRENGELAAWFASGPDEGERILRLARTFPARAAAIRAIVPRAHDKSFAAIDSKGGMAIGNTTSGIVVWEGESLLEGLKDVVFAPGSMALVGESAWRSAVYDLRHPELTLSTLLLPTWYEGYAGPAQIWQSTGGWQGYERKLGLSPLVFGTLKGAFYALVVALPLGIFAALYTSQFMHPTLRSTIKPGMEMLSAFPTVVLGFVAGVWMAPRLAPALAGLILAALLVPLAALAGGWLWSIRPASLKGRIEVVGELAVIMLFTALALFVAFALGPAVEKGLLGEDVLSAMSRAGLVYEQRNALLVGIVMGFAVVPLVFSVAEDAFSGVPRSLISGSLALGATPWRTVREIVLPTASPGIVAAALLGLGRALGETMIVLMVAGNTPLISGSPFTGFRALTATIAVEIQDAAPGSPLFTVLILASFALLLTTFLVNGAAEIVREVLRRRVSALREV